MNTTTRRRSLLFFCFMLLAALAPATVSAEGLTPEQIAAKLQKKYEATNSITADFRQITTMQYTNKKQTAAGTLAIQKPGRMRWDYKTPNVQVILCDGKTISLYFQEEKQMITGSAEKYLQSDVTYSFFTGTGDILRDFEVTAPPHDPLETKDAYVIRLFPRKPHPQVDFLFVWITKETFLIETLKIFDQLGSITEIFLTNTKVNEAIPDTHFLFNPPAGTEIIEQ